MLYARTSAERIGVLIGPEGTTKERLQKATGTRISVDSTTGDVTIDEAQAQDPVLALKAKDIIQAMARGFSEDRAFRLLDEDAYFEVFDIKDFAHSRNRVAQIRARLIGTRGKTRRLIEELTGVEVSVWGHTIALIGGTFEMAIAREAVFMLLRGSEHKTVYRLLERKRADIKVYQMGVWTVRGHTASLQPIWLRRLLYQLRPTTMGIRSGEACLPVRGGDRLHAGPPRRQGRRPRGNDPTRPPRPARFHDHDESLQRIHPDGPLPAGNVEAGRGGPVRRRGEGRPKVRGLRAAAARLRPFRGQALDARDDGHGPEPRPQRHDRRGPRTDRK